MGLALDQLRVEAVLDGVSDAAVDRVESLREGTEQIAHAVGEIRDWRLHDEVRWLVIRT